MKRFQLFAILFLVLFSFLLVSCRGGHVTQQTNDGFVQRDTGAKAQGSASAENPTSSGIIAQGRFVADAHRTQGIAVLLQTANSTLLVFNGFAMESAPGLAVYLSKNTDTTGAVSLGLLSSGAGDQSYAVPASAASYRTVLIYSPNAKSLYGHAAMQ